MLTHDAVREIVAVARAGSAVTKLGQFGFHSAELFAAGGQIQLLEKRRAPRQYTALTEENVVAAIRATKTDPSRCVIFVSLDRVLAVLDELDERIDSVVFEPVKTQAMKSVIELEDREWLQHEDFVRMLRFDLRGTSGADDVLPAFRSLDFTNTKNRQSEVQQLSGSIKASHLAQVSGALDLPEEIMLRVQPFAHTPDQRCDVKCFVEIDPFKAVLRLVPCPVHMEDLRRFAVELLAKNIAEANTEQVAVVLGTGNLAY